MMYSSTLSSSSSSSSTPQLTDDDETEFNDMCPKGSRVTYSRLRDFTQEDLNGLKKKWFPDDPENQGILQSIWVRQQQVSQVAAAAATTAQVSPSHGSGGGRQQDGSEDMVLRLKMLESEMAKLSLEKSLRFKMLEGKMEKLDYKVDATSHQGSQSRAKWLQSMEINLTLQTRNNFFEYYGLEDASTNEQLSNLVDNGGIDDFDFSLNLTEEPRTGKGSRAHFGEVVLKVVHAESRDHCCESRNTPTIGTFKPDYLLRHSGRGGEHSIVIVGEVKSMAATKEAGFADEEVGQILDFLKELLIVQGWRQWAFGFITDTFRFEFFCAVRGQGNIIKFHRSTLFTGAAGWVHLNMMMNATNEKLGFVPIEVEGWTLGKWLGSGATASVFAASSENCFSAVCKVYLGQQEGLRSNEVRALEKMKNDPSSPKLVDGSPSSTARGGIDVLLVTPQGKTLGRKGERVSIKTFSLIVDALKTSHEGGICHCDVCPDNMFAVKTLESSNCIVILNDWGSSKLLDGIAKNVDYDGIRTHHKFNNVNEMGCAQDLAALVRSVFALTQSTFDIETVESIEELDYILRAQWRWGDALDLALNTNYSAVKCFFETGSIATFSEDGGGL